MTVDELVKEAHTGEVKVGINIDIKPVFEKISRLNQIFEEANQIIADLQDFTIDYEIVQKDGNDG